MIDRSTERTRLLAPRSAEEPTALTTEEGCGGAKNGCSGGVAHSPPPPPLKSIGRLGSIAIAVNSLAGPAVLQLPFCYQQSGLIPTTLCLMGVAVLSALACLHTANVVSLMPQTQTTASAASNRSSAASNRSSAAAIPGTTHDEKHDPPINGNHLNPKFAQNNDASTATVAGALSTFTTNVNFEAPVEFSDPYRVFWHQKAYICTQILFYLAVVALNVASIIDTAQGACVSLGVTNKQTNDSNDLTNTNQI